MDKRTGEGDIDGLTGKNDERMGNNMTSQTKNCVECAFRLKRRKATVWCGAVLFITDTEKRTITAGWCRYHQHIDMPRKKHLNGCVALWTADMGLE